MSDVTRLLEAVQLGDQAAGEQLLGIVYQELRQLARAKMALELPGNTLQPTALVHEAWMRLGEARFQNRAHFFGAAAEAMRRILIERARRKLTAKRGAGAEHVDSDDIEIAAPGGTKEDELVAVDDALKALAAQDARKAELVKLRHFVGLTSEQAAEVLGISKATADREWAFARAWLFREIKRTRETPN
ncbi:MAG: sigma-70 family RNA polymerase sigma factor [Verrucomicrobiaceae bacterium]|nr:sigma-70 family RNA polymerase sigma factor [Verrucomicrobiaceae bacterium]